jgi:hypothetical protein
MRPGRRTPASIDRLYGRVHALDVVRAAMADYDDHFASQLPRSETTRTGR